MSLQTCGSLKTKADIFLTPHVLATQAEIKMLKRENEKDGLKQKHTC
jgi:hypothetical protein